MTDRDIIVGLNSIAAKYGYGKNGNEAFSNDEWGTIERAKEIIREYESARHCAEVTERALVIMAERMLEYAEKANVTAMTSDGFFSCDKDVQLALLVNDALLKAEAQLEEIKEKNND